MDRAACEQRARDSLLGLSVGDAVGEAFFGRPDEVVARIRARELPQRMCRWTDDTAMGIALVLALVAADGDVDERLLMDAFVATFDIARGYGHLTRELLIAVARGADPEPLVAAAHGGQGSWGNGAAMRVAPLGAWHAGDPTRAAVLARRQARVTHGHPEAAEGAAAVAACASIMAARTELPDRATLLGEIARHCRPGGVQNGLLLAASLTGATSHDAAAVLGNGREVSAADTVPFALWAACGTPDDLVETFWTTVSALGDRDTTCAISCSTVAGRVGAAGIPEEWTPRVEPLGLAL